MTGTRRFGLKRSTSLLAAISVLGPAAGEAAAQATNITVDICLLFTGTLVYSSGAGTFHTITGGTPLGTNLFHSFNNFDLASGHTASWQRSNASAFTNVINRVTGGGVSDIAGTIDASQFSNAQFYFINPAGIVFGDGTQINVPGAVHFSLRIRSNFLMARSIPRQRQRARRSAQRRRKRSDLLALPEGTLRSDGPATAHWRQPPPRWAPQDSM